MHYVSINDRCKRDQYEVCAQIIEFESYQYLSFINTNNKKVCCVSLRQQHTRGHPVGESSQRETTLLSNAVLHRAHHMLSAKDSSLVIKSFDFSMNRPSPMDFIDQRHIKIE